MPDLFRQSIGLESLWYCAAVGGFAALRMRHAPCGYTKYNCTFQTSPCQKISRHPLLLINSELPLISHAIVGEGHAPPGDALAVRTNRRQNGKHHQVCHCEAPTGPWQSREGSCDFADGIPTMRLRTARLPRRFAPRNDNSGKCRGAPMPFSGLRPLYKALTERRYTPYFGFYHFTDSLYKSAVQCRAGTALPLQWRLPF